MLLYTMPFYSEWNAWQKWKSVGTNKNMSGCRENCYTWSHYNRSTLYIQLSWKYYSNRDKNGGHMLFASKDYKKAIPKMLSKSDKIRDVLFINRCYHHTNRLRQTTLWLQCLQFYRSYEFNIFKNINFRYFVNK